jgi:hypothetical protein
MASRVPQGCVFAPIDVGPRCWVERTHGLQREPRRGIVDAVLDAVLAVAVLVQWRAGFGRRPRRKPMI